MRQAALTPPVCYSLGCFIWHQAGSDLPAPRRYHAMYLHWDGGSSPRHGLSERTRLSGTFLRPNPPGSSRLQGGGGPARVPAEEVPSPGSIREKCRHCTEAETKPCLWRWGRGCALGRTPRESKQPRGGTGRSPTSLGCLEGNATAGLGKGAGLAPLLSILPTACWGGSVIG